MRIRWTPGPQQMIWSTSGTISPSIIRILARSTVLELYEAIRFPENIPTAWAPGRSQEPTNWSFLVCPTLLSTALRNKPSEVLHVHHAAQNRP